MRRGRISSISDAIVSLAKNEDDLKRSVAEMVEFVEARLKEIGTSGQEKIRDAIRSETFSSAFRDKVLTSI